LGTGDLTDEELLAECDVETFRAGGPGGQHQNKTESAVRLRHRPTGVVVTSRSERSQFDNKRICLRRLRQKLTRLEEQPEPRLPTSVPRGVQRRRVEDKRLHGRKKRERTGPVEPEED
jgi:protein subunit release factor A